MSYQKPFISQTPLGVPLSNWCMGSSTVRCMFPLVLFDCFVLKHQRPTQQHNDRETESDPFQAEKGIQDVTRGERIVLQSCAIASQTARPALPICMARHA